MMRIWKRLAMLVLACLLASCCFMMNGCGAESEEANVSENIGPKIICKADDFEKVRGEWYGTDSLVSSQAEAIATTALVAGERYYFVYTFGLDSEHDGDSSTYMEYNLKFEIKTWDGLYDGTDVVIFEPGTLPTDGEIFATIDEKGTVDTRVSLTAKGTRAYIAVPFTPTRVGMLFIDSIVSFDDRGAGYTPLNDTVPRVFANVFESETQADSAATATISNLSYGLINQEVYESGGLDTATDLAEISQMSTGRNYVVLDFDVTSENGSGGEVYCGIYMHDGKWEDVTLEEANTAKYNQSDLGGGRILDFSYSLPTNGTKRVRTVLSFTALDICSIDFEFFVYSDNAKVSGTLYNRDNFADANVSKLTYRVDHGRHSCYVTGYETMPGYVIVPGFYENYPVVGIEASAFEGCTELISADLGEYVTDVEYYAFRNCTSLTTVYIPKSLEGIKSGIFEGCTALENAFFENPYAWTINGTDENILVMDEPAYAAEQIIENVDDNLWWNPTVEIQNLKVGFVESEVYRGGDFEEEINWFDLNWGQHLQMEAEQAYYWILELDLTVLSDSPKKSWGISFNKTKDYRFVLEEVIGTDLECRTDSSSSDVGYYSVYLDYGEKTDEPTHLRFVFEVVPVSGGRQMELKFYSDGLFKCGYSYFHGISGELFEEISLSVW